MIYAELPLKETEGAFLVHSVKVQGKSFKKGRVLSADDIAELAEAGYQQLLVARLEGDDVREDEAADMIASAFHGPGTRLQPAFTGRANIYADCHGLAVLDTARIDELNFVHEAITIATLDNFNQVHPGQMLATVKIIPFSARKEILLDATDIAAHALNRPIRVMPFKAKEAGLIMTILPDSKESVLDKTRAVLQQRLEILGSRISREIRCNHDREAIAAALREMRQSGCDMILIFGASAITDRRDEVPAAIEMAGGMVDHFGMPVDPGNLLLLAHDDRGPIIGLPGCARSPKLNGFDWVLQRLCADIDVTRRDIMSMGVGGLLKEIALRPQPRRGKMESPAYVPHIGALILAAGQSRRMGKDNKLLQVVDGDPMVVHAVKAARDSQCENITVVLGHEEAEVRQLLKDFDVTFVKNEDFASGLSTSLRAGLAALPKGLDGVVILLGDMPGVSHRHVDKLIAAFDPREGRSICVPTVAGKRGNPVLFGSQHFNEMLHASGDIGAKHVIGQNEDVLAEVAMDDAAVLIDIDTPEALAAALANRET